MLFHLSALTLDNIIIFPAGRPSLLTPEQQAKTDTGTYVLLVPSIVGGLILLLQSHASYRKLWSYSRLSTLWMWSVALVAIGVANQGGRFTPFTDFLAILHIQIEWLIIALLLNASPATGYVAASLGGGFLYICMFALPGIKGSFFVTSVVGGFGDVFMPVLLFYTRQWALAIGGVGHFLNAFFAFQSFVQYSYPSTYYPIQFIVVSLHSIATVLGVLSSRSGSGPPGISSGNDSPIRLENGENDEPDHVKTASIPRSTLIKLIILTLALDLAAAIPINFAPRK